MFMLKAAEKALGWSIISAVAFAAHAGDHFVLLQLPLVLITGVLDPSMGLMDQTRSRLTTPVGHCQSIQNQLRTFMCLSMTQPTT
jgi:hypothetical protein